MIKLTETASAEIKRLMSQQGIADGYVRFGVENGGCSGMQYSMGFDDQSRREDQIFTQNDLQIVCDSRSLPYLSGLEVDFSNKLMGGGFKFQNPNAVRSCGCGTSFRTEDQVAKDLSCT